MIGVLGGSFDPVHEGHAHLAKLLLQEYPFTKLILVPNTQNPLKTHSPKASSDFRLQLLQASLKEIGDPRLEVSDIEIRRKGKSYTVDTIRELKKQHSSLVLILGNEVFKLFDQWREPKEILQSVDLILVNRENDYSVNVEEMLSKLHILDSQKISNLKITHSNNSHWIEQKFFSVLPYSSTVIRQELKEAWKKDELQSPVRGIQRSVWQVIKVNNLYAR